jgi:L-iditol 2-dehydrogenase
MSYSAPFPGREWRLASHYFASGQLRFDERMIFAKFPLARIAEGFDLFCQPGQVKGKILLEIN